MSENIDIKHLAELARIDIDDEQTESLKESIADILSYVSSVEEAAGQADDAPSVGSVYNRLRKDADPHEGGTYTDDLLAEAPETENGFVVVPPILD
jgi:aspartyl-tRNA(Asn)/glutamyl-tRNA(Gln) amidotransferase subunit C